MLSAVDNVGLCIPRMASPSGFIYSLPVVVRETGSSFISFSLPYDRACPVATLHRHASVFSDTIPDSGFLTLSGFFSETLPVNCQRLFSFILIESRGIESDNSDPGGALHNF